MMMKFLKMIKTIKNDKDKQYISILVGKGAPTEELYNHIIKLCPELQNNLYKKDDIEILFEIPKVMGKTTGCSYCSDERFVRGLTAMLYYLQG